MALESVLAGSGQGRRAARRHSLGESASQAAAADVQRAWTAAGGALSTREGAGKDALLRQPGEKGHFYFASEGRFLLCVDRPEALHRQAPVLLL